MSDPIDIMKNKAHFNVLAICIPCGHRWIGMVMANVSLFKLECPRCFKQDSFASFIPIDYLQEVARV